MRGVVLSFQGNRDEGRDEGVEDLGFGAFSFRLVGFEF